MTEYKLEITKKLEDMDAEGTLDSSVAILNLPSANYCEKRVERVEVSGGLQQSCLGCVTQKIKTDSALGIDEIKKSIDHFAKEFSTKFITINGRGDPLNPKVRDDNLEKIRYAHEKYDIKAYLFTAGNNLDDSVCQTLADCEVNVMMSLFGNRFIHSDFFSGRDYPSVQRPLQNQKDIASNFRRLISVYKNHEKQPEIGTTRLGMNYVISTKDLEESEHTLRELKESVNRNRIFFVCNTSFLKNENLEVQNELSVKAQQYTDFNLRHSTAVKGQCQMGAGSSATLDYDGMLLRCPYMDNKTQGNGKFSDLTDAERRNVIQSYMKDREFPCVMRKHQK
ncbi:hypothetical protein COU54_02355 [Candidatus Pacearchaeota archaeon CG10_big_fil_rev_8_21_14_0_10_31_24]|nr:MAG: hypothetical protein COU54_02355 [Candidatus Pacearchaeota archaeon CG10_big_fil_rev_8_21_14_0_10_31_24]